MSPVQDHDMADVVTTAAAPDRKTYVVYDGDCPFCSAYVNLLRLREAVGPVELLDARKNHPVVRMVEERGVVLDQEMALVMGDAVYSGGDCINRLALMSTPSGFFNRINAALFSSPRLSRLAYPFLRTGRNLALKVLGRKPIRP
jgi:predicted DCC family thiol-disulfide oxidoreductase YuxK